MRAANLNSHMSAIFQERPAFVPTKPLVLHIRRHRLLSGDTALSQRVLAQKAGLSRHALSRLERARVLPKPVADLVAIANVLNVGLDDLLAPHLFAQKGGQLVS